MGRGKHFFKENNDIITFSLFLSASLPLFALLLLLLFLLLWLRADRAVCF